MGLGELEFVGCSVREAVSEATGCFLCLAYTDGYVLFAGKFKLYVFLLVLAFLDGDLYRKKSYRKQKSLVLSCL